jgi:hypothetical protein
MCVHDALGDVQAEPKAAVVLRGHGTFEAIEDAV